jgi:arabinogalactan oligomer/maltooligosaccharide transport system substrate-binding protein
LVGLPLGLEGVVLFRNRTIIPEAPRTLQEMIVAAREATQGEVVGTDLEAGSFYSASHLAACGGRLMDENGDPAFNNEAGICWLNLFKTFQGAGIPSETYTDNDLNLFKEGRAGLVVDGTWNTAALAEAIGAENLAIDPWPVTDQGHLSGFVRADPVLFLNANASVEEARAAWAFSEYLLSPASQALLAGPEGGGIPAVASAAGDDRFVQEALAAFENGVPLPVSPEVEAYWDPLDAAIQAVLEEDADPAEALQRAFDSVSAAIEALRSRERPAPAR